VSTPRTIEHHPDLKTPPAGYVDGGANTTARDIKAGDYLLVTSKYPRDPRTQLYVRVDDVNRHNENLLYVNGNLPLNPNNWVTLLRAAPPIKVGDKVHGPLGGVVIAIHEDRAWVRTGASTNNIFHLSDLRTA
jgi:hypothetical protein